MYLVEPSMGVGVTLTCSVTDFTFGTYTVCGLLLQWTNNPATQTWTAGTDIALTFMFVEARSYSIQLTVKDAGGNTAFNIVGVTISQGEETTSTPPKTTEPKQQNL